MKQFNTVKILLLFVLLGCAGSVIGQTFHPLAFDTIPPYTGNVANWYKDYVGARLLVTNPSAVAGSKIFTITNDGISASGQWGAAITTPIVNKPVVMALPDSFGCSTITNFAAMSGNIALIWRGPISGACEFGAKALAAQNAGAVACVLINEYPGEGPVGMGPGASGTSVTIPVLMIGNLDGIAISAQYHSNPAGTVRMSLIPWGQAYQNDLGFCPGGLSVWHDHAIPASMLGGENPLAYKCIDGGFIANFGTHNATNVKLTSFQSFTPTGGSAGPVHRDSISLTSFPVTDSIWAMFAPSEFDLTAISSTGRYDLSYAVTSDSTDQFPSDNTWNYSFYATDSIFCKGRYDFAEGHPLTSKYYRANGNCLWGTPYYVTKGGDAFKDVQFSIATGVGLLPATQQLFYIFKWVDGSFGAGSSNNSLEGGELQLVGTCSRTFDGIGDSSDEYYTTTLITSDSNNTGHFVPVKIDSNSWYYVAADITPASPTQGTFLGVDGELSMFPRSFGRKHFHGEKELYNPALDTNKTDMRGTYQAATFDDFAFGLSFNVDSVIYNREIGMIPNLALRIMPYTTPPVDHTGVNSVPTGALKFEVFPNPASDVINVNIELAAAAKTVSYTIFDNHARIISRETHNNVLNETYSYSTSKLASGVYYVIVNADGKQMYRTVTIAK